MVSVSHPWIMLRLKGFLIFSIKFDDKDNICENTLSEEKSCFLKNWYCSLVPYINNSYTYFYVSYSISFDIKLLFVPHLHKYAALLSNFYYIKNEKSLETHHYPGMRNWNQFLRYFFSWTLCFARFTVWIELPTVPTFFPFLVFRILVFVFRLWEKQKWDGG